MNEEQRKQMKKELHKSLDEFNMAEMQVPRHIHNAVVGYVVDGSSVGDFLQAVINNDLSKAVGHADTENTLNLPAVVSWFYNEAPSDCWGRTGAYRYWRDRKSPTVVQ